MDKAVLDVVPSFSFESIVVCTFVGLEEKAHQTWQCQKKMGSHFRQRKALIKRQQTGGEHTDWFSSHFYSVPLDLRIAYSYKTIEIPFPRFALKSTTIGIDFKHVALLAFPCAWNWQQTTAASFWHSPDSEIPSAGDPHFLPRLKTKSSDG